MAAMVGWLFQDAVTCALISETGSVIAQNSYFQVITDKCVVVVNRDLVADFADRREYTVRTLSTPQLVNLLYSLRNS